MANMVATGDVAVSLYCNEVTCGHGGSVRVADLIARYGRAVTVAQLKFRCRACGSTNIKTIVPWQAYCKDHGIGMR